MVGQQRWTSTRNVSLDGKDSPSARVLPSAKYVDCARKTVLGIENEKKREKKRK